MPYDKIAMIFDFDDTLVPDSTTALLKKYKIDAARFWKIEFGDLLKKGWCPTHAYLKLILDKAKPGGALQNINNKSLRDFGKTLKPYPGLPDFFNRIRKIVKGFHEISIHFYVVSGGLEEIIQGCSSIRKNLDWVWGCRLSGADNGDTQPLYYVKRAITFSEKTRYLFEINKGLDPKKTQVDPNLVNKDVLEKDRPVPFHHMIYVGDGLTDIPCFSLLTKRELKGYAIGILDDKKNQSEKVKAIRSLLYNGRTMGMYKPDYRRGSDLSENIETFVADICLGIQADRSRTYR